MDIKKTKLLNKQVVPINSMVPVREYRENEFIAVFENSLHQADLAFFIVENRSRIEQLLVESGVVIFRGFDVGSVDKFHRAVLALGYPLQDYEFGSTPRTEISTHIYTSTEYPASQHIPMHNEMSYTNRWPGKIWFYCEQPAAEGGETPIVDGRKVYEKIPVHIRDLFEKDGIRYVRNYRDGIDVPWQNVFRTEDPLAVASYCQSRNIQYQWHSSQHLQTWQTCQASIVFKETGEKVWFNQAHLFHYTNLPEAVRESLLELYDEEGMPRNSYLGNGQPITEEHIRTIMACYQALKVPVALKKDHVMLLNNTIIGHGRNPYAGTRKVRVAMTN